MLGRYEIKRLLGQGGMGRVYEGEHRDLKKRVAIKTLLPALAASGDARERFLREGEAASRIRHPHVVDVTDVGSEGSVIYLVMEYLEGEDLARLIARQRFLSPLQTVEIMLPVAAAIATAHQQGVIHRDLKPENIFLARSGYGAIQPKVLDFGISKVLGGSGGRQLTGTAATIGTMNYLPPESLNAAREADARSDQYALGTILYECVTGQRAFEEENFYLVLKKIAEGVFVPPSALRLELPRRLESVILRAMSLEPGSRFESVLQLGAAMLEFASEGIRGFWAPFFGPVPPVSATDRPAAATQVASPSGGIPHADARGSGESPRVRTLAAPSSGAGGTIELPPPPAPKSASTTMRNATGERAVRATTFPMRRSRAPFVIGGVGLVAAVAAVVLLRAGDLNTQRAESSAASVDPVSASPSPAPATTITPPPPLHPAVAPAVAPPPPEPARPERPAPADQRNGVVGSEDPTGKPLAKRGRGKGLLRGGAQKRIKAGAKGPAAGEPGPAEKPAGDVVIID
jgi:serine/threonine-protein kinase